MISIHQFEFAKAKLGQTPGFTFEVLPEVDHFMSDQKSPAASLAAIAQMRQTKTMPALSAKLQESLARWLKTH